MSTKTYSGVFNKKVSREIAEKSFGHVLDCVLGYSDSEYGLKTPIEQFEQNFEEDLQERGINATERRIRIISAQYDKLVKQFEKFVRGKYKFYDKK